MPDFALLRAAALLVPDRRVRSLGVIGIREAQPQPPACVDLLGFERKRVGPIGLARAALLIASHSRIRVDPVSLWR